MPDGHYANLAQQEARFWGDLRPSAENPQLWEDPILFDLFLRADLDFFVKQIAGVGGSVLELGGGEGWLSIELAKLGMRVKAIDISEDRINRANERALRECKNTPSSLPAFEVGDLNTYLPARSAYDVVVAHDALHHILLLDRLLGESAKALKPGGRIFVYDFVGMGTVRKLFAAFLYGVLPTHQSYAAKLKRAGRFGTFMKQEKGKREDVRRKSEKSPSGSPFEEISQESILPLLGKHFEIINMRESHPFFFYLAPKLLCPAPLKQSMWKLFRHTDAALLRYGIAHGAYVFVEAAPRT